MTAEAEDVLYEVFDLLFDAWVAGKDEPTRMVGLQGQAIVIFQKDGQHLALRMVPVELGAPA